MGKHRPTDDRGSGSKRPSGRGIGKRRESPIYVTICVERLHCPRCSSTDCERTRTKGRFVEGLIIRHMRCRACQGPFTLYIQTVEPKTLPKRD